MEMVLLKSMQDYTELPLTKWKIKQPRIDEIREDALSTGGLDLIIVPGVAFTKTGDRMGHGMGYYDRYLQHCLEYSSSRKPLTIALAFNEQILDMIPTDEKDFKMDLVLTP